MVAAVLEPSTTSPARHPTTSETYPPLRFPLLRVLAVVVAVVVVARDLALALMSFPVAAFHPVLTLVLVLLLTLIVNLALVSVRVVDIGWYTPTCPSTHRD